MLTIIENILILLSSLSALGVIFSSNPIQSLLCLILSFALSSMLFLICGIEFISLLIFMVYVGAIAVLFLFIIMMLNIKIVELRSSYLRYIPVGSFIIFFFFFELCFFFYLEFFSIYKDILIYDWMKIIVLQDNIFLISSVIYSYYAIYFFCLALILLISMIGSIILVINWGPLRAKALYNNVYNYKHYSVKFFK